jgi:hypothetical protein
VTREPDPSGFDAIVAAWRAEGNVPEWPDDLHLDEARREARTDLRADTRPAPETEHSGGGDGGDGSGGGEDGADDRSTGRSDPDHAAPSGSPTAGQPRTTDPDADRPTAARPDAMHADHPDPGTDHNDRFDDDHPDVARPSGAPRRGTDRRDEGAAGRRAGDAERGHPARPGAAQPEPDEHFVPPEPPPLPRMGPPILIGLTLIGLGLVLVTFPGWVGVPQVYGLPLGLVAIAAGLGWLVLRLWPDPDDVPPPLYLDDPDDPDGGAVL